QRLTTAESRATVAESNAAAYLKVLSERTLVPSIRSSVVFNPTDRSDALSALASAAQARGDFEEAKKLATEALQVRGRIFGPEHPKTIELMVSLATIYTSSGDLDNAEAFLRRALAIEERVLGPEKPNIATILNSLASLYTRRGDLTKAQQLLERALAIQYK